MILNDVIIFYPESIRADMALFARQQGVDWLLLAHNSRQLDLQRLRDQATTEKKRKSFWHKLGMKRSK
jgi:hypothetical protein